MLYFYLYKIVLLKKSIFILNPRSFYGDLNESQAKNNRLLAIKSLNYMIKRTVKEAKFNNSNLELIYLRDGKFWKSNNWTIIKNANNFQDFDKSLSVKYD